MDERITLSANDDELRLRPDRAPVTRVALVVGFVILVAFVALIIIVLR